MKVIQDEIDRYMALLKETVERVEAAVSGVDKTAIQSAGSGKKSWSINEILAHLRACSDIWAEDIDRMLVEDEPTLRYRSPRTYMKGVRYHLVDFEESYKIFKAERAALLVLLSGLAFEQWERGAIIKGRRHTVFSQVRRMALHEKAHWVQLESLREAILST